MSVANATQPSRVKLLLVASLALFVVVEIVILSPSTLDEPSTWGFRPTLNPQDAITHLGVNDETLAPGIPKGKIPDYTLKDFSYAANQGVQKMWRLQAKNAVMFQKEQLVHSRQVMAHLYNAGDEPTIVTGKEAKYFSNQRDLEVFGDVTTVFPDGFTLYSQYILYHPDTRKIEIPPNQPVRGEGISDEEKTLSFTSEGMDFSMEKNHIVLPKHVRLKMKRNVPRTANTQGVADDTTIEADRCEIDRIARTADFSMDRRRPIAERFVKTRQEKLLVYSRTGQLNYGEFSTQLNYMKAFDDVLIYDTSVRDRKNSEGAKYATCGQADFDTRKNIIILRKFPQVYQNSDTVTGETILIHKETDIVEVDHSNAYSEGR
ncbi:MAG: LPS export ABC transporter periplasmic protein LptC [Bacteriovoracia bacterium]